MPNIQEKPTRPKGNGSDKPPRHPLQLKGVKLSRLKDGCNKNPTCEDCPIPIEECRGRSYNKQY
jgi:hypothetical protein